MQCTSCTEILERWSSRDEPGGTDDKDLIQHGAMVYKGLSDTGKRAVLDTSFVENNSHLIKSFDYYLINTLILL